MDQVAQVFGFARVRVVVGEITVDLAEQLDDLAADGAQYLRRAGPGHTVARIDHDAHGPRQAYVGDDAIGIGLIHRHRQHAATALQLPVFVLHHAAQALNFFAVNSASVHHHLETVVVARVVAAGDLYAAAAQGVCGEIQLRRGDHADINHLHARVYQALYQCLRQRGAAEPPIAPDGNLCLPAGHGLCAETAAQGQCDIRVE